MKELKLWEGEGSFAGGNSAQVTDGAQSTNYFNEPFLRAINRLLNLDRNINCLVLVSRIYSNLKEVLKNVD